jgi:hypothetical protein
MLTAFAAATLGITGIYFESRTCSIFAGPCHYNGEVMSDGRGAIVALGFQSGAGLAGLSAAAVVLGDENLNRSDQRKAVIYIDVAATEEQGQRMTELLKARAGFGMVLAVRPATIHFEVSGLDSNLSVKSGDSIVISAQTNGSDCKNCSMPGILWYKPLVHGTDTKVATVQKQTFSDAILGETWSRGEEAAAFVGTFAW